MRTPVKTAVSRLVSAIASLADPASTSFDDPIPTEWDKQGAKAWELYLTNNAVKKAIATWRALVFGSGIQWIASKTAREKLDAWALKIRLEPVIRDAYMNMLIRGEGVPYKHRGPGGKFERLRSLNPMTIEPTWNDGLLVSARALDVDDKGKAIAGSKGKPIRPEDLFYLRNDASEWMKHGSSICLAAMPWCEIQTDYQKADRAIAKRFAGVLRILRVGGTIGNKIFSPGVKEMKEAKKVIDTMDANKILVAPSYWDLKTSGAEGEALDIVPRIKAINDQIAMSLLFYPVFVTGDSGDFATAKSLLKVLRLQILEMRGFIRFLMDWLLSPDVRSVIGIGATEKVGIGFGAIDLDVEEWERKLLRQLKEDGVLSRRTIQTVFGFDPDEEDENIDREPPRAAKLWKPEHIINAAKDGIGTKKGATSHMPAPKKTAEAE